MRLWQRQFIPQKNCLRWKLWWHWSKHLQGRILWRNLAGMVCLLKIYLHCIICMTYLRLINKCLNKLEPVLLSVPKGKLFSTITDLIGTRFNGQICWNHFILDLLQDFSINLKPIPTLNSHQWVNRQISGKLIIDLMVTNQHLWAKRMRFKTVSTYFWILYQLIYIKNKTFLLRMHQRSCRCHVHSWWVW